MSGHQTLVNAHLGQYSTALQAAGLTAAQAETTIRNANRFTLVWPKLSDAGTHIDDAMAADTTAESVSAAVPFDGIVRSVTYVPDSSLTSHDTTYATLTVAFRDGAGGAAATVASQTTKTTSGGGSGDWVAFKNVPLTLTAANVAVTAGGVLTTTIAKASTGVAVKKGFFIAVIERT